MDVFKNDKYALGNTELRSPKRAGEFGQLF